jgi:hypothetical protein
LSLLSGEGEGEGEGVGVGVGVTIVAGVQLVGIKRRDGTGTMFHVWYGTMIHGTNDYDWSFGG